VAGSVQDLSNGHGIVLNAAAFYKPSLGRVNEGVGDRLNAGGKDLGEEFAVTIE
jgi:hypothetical protein